MSPCRGNVVARFCQDYLNHPTDPWPHEFLFSFFAFCLQSSSRGNISLSLSINLRVPDWMGWDQMPGCLSFCLIRCEMTCQRCLVLLACTLCCHTSTCIQLSLLQFILRSPFVWTYVSINLLHSPFAGLCIYLLSADRFSFTKSPRLVDRFSFIHKISQACSYWIET